MKGVKDGMPRPGDGAKIPDEERADSSGYSEDSWDAYVDNWADLFAGAENELPKVQRIGHGRLCFEDIFLSGYHV